MAAIRARQWQTQEFWEDRIGGYLSGSYSPQHALSHRAVWVAVEGHTLAGFVAGHRTRRFDCDGELQWINVVEEFQGGGIADQLIGAMFAWFREQKMQRVCVNVDPANDFARSLYAKHGATPLNEYWMVWQIAARQP